MIELSNWEKFQVGYINKDDIIETLVNQTYYNTEDICYFLDQVPITDAVEVVRCKDCIFSRKVDSREPMYTSGNICRYGCTQWLGSDDFCSYGER